MILVVIAAMTSFGDVLWWCITDTATVDGRDIYSFINDYGTVEEDGYTYYNVGARVTCTFADRRKEVIPIAYPDFPGERFTSADFFDGGGKNSAGFGTGWWATQSPLHEMNGYTGELLNEAIFQAELGLLSYDELLDLVGFDTIAKSETVTGKYLNEQIKAIFAGGVNVPASNQWLPYTFSTYNSAPEPNSLVLLLLGGGL